MTFLAALPILLLLAAIIGLRINTIVASLSAAVVAAFLVLTAFGGNLFLLSVASGKGLSLSFFVLLIIWTSLLLYNLMHSLGLMRAIASSMARIVSERLGLALLCGWAFAGFIEGIAGFGVPVAILAPLLIAIGFKPLTAVVIVLVGHSWAVTFGGMAAAYYTIQLATGLPEESIGPIVSLLFVVPIVGTGLLVAYVEGGWQSLRRGLPVVLPTGLVMAACVSVSVYLNVAQIAAVVAGLAGSFCIWGLSRTPLLSHKPPDENPVALHTERPVAFHLAFAPYYILVLLALLTQLPTLKQATSGLYIAVDYPAVHTSLGYSAPAVQDYARINLVGHPAPIILVSAAVTILLFRRSRLWRPGAVADAIRSSFRQSWRPTLSVTAMVMISLMMNDAGMTGRLATAIAGTTGAAYPIISPFIGVLGCFMTGSNANANVMFGALQADAARALGIGPAVTAGAQTVGASLGASIAPAKVLLGSSAAGLGGQESAILRKTLAYCLLLTFLAGIVCWIVAQTL